MDGPKIDKSTGNGLMDWMAEKWTDGYGWRENG